MRLIIPLFLAALLPSLLWSEDRWSVLIKPDIKVAFGQVNEIVYPTIVAKSPYYSKLDWDITGVLLLGTSISLQDRYGSSATLSFSYGLSKGWGYMKDFDWKDSVVDQYTHYSKSRAYVDESYRLDFEIDLLLINYNAFFLNLQGSANYRYWYFRDKLLVIDYPAVEMTPSVYGYIGENSITYTFSNLFPQLGIKTGFDFKFFRVSFSLNYGFLSFIEAKDHHIFTETRYYDTIFPGNLLNFSLDSEFYPLKHWVIGLSFEFEHLFETKGFSQLQIGNNNKQMSLNRAGASYSVFVVTVSSGFVFRF